LADAARAKAPLLAVGALIKVIVLIGGRKEYGVVNDSKKKFFVYIFIYFMLMVGDLVLTYIGTPDLKYEANPLVEVFGLGWGALIAHCMLGFLFCSGFTYYAFIRYRRPLLKCEGYRQYVSMLLYGCPDRKKVAKKKVEFKNFCGVYGNTLAEWNVIIGIIVIIDWIGALSHNPIYYWYAVNIRSILPRYLGFSLFEVAILICCYYCTLYKWYCVNKKELERIKDT